MMKFAATTFLTKHTRTNPAIFRSLCGMQRANWVLVRQMGTKFGMNCTFIVARYRPLGNVGNEFATDVSKGNFDSSYCSHVQRDTLPRIDNVWKEYRYRAKIPRIKKIEIL